MSYSLHACQHFAQSPAGTGTQTSITRTPQNADLQNTSAYENYALSLH